MDRRRESLSERERYRLRAAGIDLEEGETGFTVERRESRHEPLEAEKQTEDATEGWEPLESCKKTRGSPWSRGGSQTH